MKSFEYFRPSSFEEACQLLGRSKGRSKALAGGTDLLVQLKQERIRPDAVVSLRDVPGLSFIRRGDNRGVSIGAMTPLGVIEMSDEILNHWPAFAEATSRIGSVQVRSRATLGGNLWWIFLGTVIDNSGALQYLLFLSKILGTLNSTKLGL